MSFIEVNNLRKVYHTGGVETVAVHGVTFSIEEGEFVAIMGPSGSGKSTLLHMIGFLDSPSGGTFHFAGKEFSEYTTREIAVVRNTQIGFVFQSFNLLARQSVLDNGALPLLYSDVPGSEWKNRALHAVEAVDLAHRKDYLASQLSGGERQRVAIARALVNEPKVIFADEPTGNLDSQSGKAVMQILQKLNRDEGHTVILITHETSTAEHADRIIHILDGKVEKEEKVKNPKDAFKEYHK